jgi:hypothetical protein
MKDFPTYNQSCSLMLLNICRQTLLHRSGHLTADIFVYLAWLTNFYCGLSLLPSHDTVSLAADIWNGARGGCDRSAEDAFSFATPDPTFAFVGGPCCPTLDFVIAFWIMIALYTLLTSLFCIIEIDVIFRLNVSKFYVSVLTSTLYAL